MVIIVGMRMWMRSTGCKASLSNWVDDSFERDLMFLEVLAML